MIKIWRNLLLRVLPAGWCLFTVTGYLMPGVWWVDWGCKITLSGTVGIWTNFLAVKMLFHPRRKHVFGIQGLIPKNRDAIAEAMADAVSSELLDADTLLVYMRESRLIEKGAGEFIKYLHKWIDDPRNRSMIVAEVGGYLKSRGMEHMEVFLEKGRRYAGRFVREYFTIETFWPRVSEWLEMELEKPDTKSLLSDIVIHMVETNDRVIASLMNSVIEEWLDRQDFLKRKLLRLGKGIFGMDEMYIRREIRRVVRDPGFTARVMRFLDENISQLSGLTGEDAVRKKASAIFTELGEEIEHWISTEGLEWARAGIVDFLESDAFWNWLDCQVDPAVVWVKESAERMVASGKFRELAADSLSGLSKHLDVRMIVFEKVRSFELERLEALIFKVSGENLCGIELIGGLLGMIAGLVLINRMFMLGLLLLGGILWFLDRIISGNGKRVSQPSSVNPDRNG